jgi:outer membrane protein
MRNATTLLLLLLVFSTAATVAADRDELMARATDPETGAFPLGWAIGPGVFYKNSVYESGDSTLLPVPAVYYRGKHCMIYVKKGGCRIFDKKNVELSAIADLRLDGYEEGDGDFLEGMDDRDPTLELGLGLEVDTPFGDIELEALADPFGVHKGQEIVLGWSAPIILKRWVFRFNPAYRWKSSDLANYYFGVEPDEAAPSRPAYRVGSTTSWSLNTTINYRISPRWLALFLAEYEGYSSDIKDSPIVDESGQFRTLVGFAVRIGARR